MNVLEVGVQYKFYVAKYSFISLIPRAIANKTDCNLVDHISLMQYGSLYYYMDCIHSTHLCPKDIQTVSILHIKVMFA